MEARLQRRVQRYGWDKAATRYEHAWRRQLEPAQQALLRLAALRAGDRVVDVACGTGLVTFAAADLVAPGGTVIGSDLSDRMIELARTRARERGAGHVRFERMDAEALALPDASCDAALCALGLMYVPDPQRAVGELTRVLAPGGRAVAAVWGARKHCGWAEVFPIVDRRVKSEVCPLFYGLGTGDALQMVFTAAGLVDVVTERIAVRLLWDSGDDACDAAFAGGPVALAYSRFDEPTRRAVHEEYLASIEAWRDGGGYAVPGEFVIVAGRRA